MMTSRKNGKNREASSVVNASNNSASRKPIEFEGALFVAVWKGQKPIPYKSRVKESVVNRNRRRSRLCEFAASFVTIWLAPKRCGNKLASSQTIFSYFRWIYIRASPINLRI
jgi:hypothetical protein